MVKQVTLLFKVGVKHRHSFCIQCFLRPARRESSDLTTDHMLLSCYARTSTAPVRRVRDDPGYSEVDPSHSHRSVSGLIHHLAWMSLAVRFTCLTDRRSALASPDPKMIPPIASEWAIAVAFSFLSFAHIPSAAP